MTDNWIGDDGAQSMSKTLKKNSSLKSLSLEREEEEIIKMKDKGKK